MGKVTIKFKAAGNVTFTNADFNISGGKTIEIEEKDVPQVIFNDSKRFDVIDDNGKILNALPLVSKPVRIGATRVEDPKKKVEEDNKDVEKKSEEKPKEKSKKSKSNKKVKESKSTVEDKE